jgi:hypothetical protein
MGGFLLFNRLQVAMMQQCRAHLYWPYPGQLQGVAFFYRLRSFHHQRGYLSVNWKARTNATVTSHWQLAYLSGGIWR